MLLKKLLSEMFGNMKNLSTTKLVLVTIGLLLSLQDVQNLIHTFCYISNTIVKREIVRFDLSGFDQVFGLTCLCLAFEVFIISSVLLLNRLEITVKNQKRLLIINGILVFLIYFIHDHRTFAIYENLEKIRTNTLTFVDKVKTIVE